MNGRKTLLLSKTFWGAILTGLAVMLDIFGVDVSEAEQSLLVESVAITGAVAGTILTIYGRFRVQKWIG